ncbi:VCBS domain-containing protein [Geminocystis sp. CENA526]|uniref:VCBS domain-containing protein n=1 Tax=Geminocystis sp. CENA526 TaxID=1355871 RepID=UPI003D6E1900
MTNHIEQPITSNLFQLDPIYSDYVELLGSIEPTLQEQLLTWFSQSDYLTQAEIPFSANVGTQSWTDNALSLQQSILSGNYSIRVEIRSNDELQGAKGAYSATGTTNQPTIYLNADWLQNATQAQIVAVLLEELGHDFDHIINDGADSQGDEGEIFAILVQQGSIDEPTLDRLRQQQDTNTIIIDGQQITVEQAINYAPIQLDPSNTNWENVARTGDPNKLDPDKSKDGGWTANSADLVGNDETPYLQVQQDGTSIAFKVLAEPQSGNFKALMGIFVDIDNDGSPDFMIQLNVDNVTGSYKVNEYDLVPIFTGSLTADSNTRPNNTVIPKLSDRVYFNLKTDINGNPLPTTATGATQVDNVKVYSNQATRSGSDGNIGVVDVDGDGNIENYYVVSFTLAQLEAFRQFIASFGNTYKVWHPSNNNNTIRYAAALTASNSLNAINGDIGGGAYSTSSSWKDIFGFVDPLPPLAVNDVLLINENTDNPTSPNVSGNLLSNDSDPNGDVLTVTQFSIAGYNNGSPYTITAGGSTTVDLLHNGVKYGELTISSNGDYTFTRTNLDYAGSVPLVTYTVSDGDIRTADSTATLFIGITPVNDAPVTNNGAVTIDEDNSYTFSASNFTFSDPVDGNPNNGTSANTLQAVIITSLPTNGTLKFNGVDIVLDGNGEFIVSASQISQLTFVPNANFNGSTNFNFLVQDNGGMLNGGIDRSNPATFTINITAVDDAPIANNSNAIAIESGSAPDINGGNNNSGTNPTGNVLSNDTDPDLISSGNPTGAVTPGVTHTLTQISFNNTPSSITAGSTSSSNFTTITGLYGELRIGADGSYEYIVNNNNPTVDALRTAGDTLTETFVYTVKDETDLTSSANLIVTIQGSNDSPVANPDFNAVSFKQGDTPLVSLVMS